ncbi:MAG: IS1380 family transposase [Proteobacteria bacterium]|nr:IS1380 family transposase [Pseudomonadota bacterium]MCP4894837.1 IS1380 family transposase [Actinomycetales bacterium]
MQTECTAGVLEFQRVGRRSIEAAFDGGPVSSDGGALLLAETDRLTGIVGRFAACFTDQRDRARVEHSVEELVRQRVFGLCLGYEDLNDHDSLRDDALFATAVGKSDPTGEGRKRERDRGHALAGKSTLNRLELTGGTVKRDARYKKVAGRDEDIERFFVEEFIDGWGDEVPRRLVLDFDPTDIELHGRQEGRFFHGYYRHYCYLPLLVFCGEALLVARMRKADIDGCAGTVDVLEWLVPQLRARWPHVELVLRADSGFARDAILTWCEEHGVEYVIGLARNARLHAEVTDELDEARALYEASGAPARVFKDLVYKTLKTWTLARRVVAKAEQLVGKANPRFVVTSYAAERFDARTLYEQEYCQRGEMENRIKEHQLDLFGERASCTPMRANQLRLWLSGVAYTLMTEFRRTALRGTDLARAQTRTIRTRLFKVGAVVRISVRRVRVALSSAFPLKGVFRACLDNLRAEYASPS